jgi:hypothetical protein
VYYAFIQQRFPRHVIPQIIPLIFLTISLGHRLLEGSSTEKKSPLLSRIFLFLWLLFPVSLGLKYLAKQFPQVFTSQNILNLSLLAGSAGLTFLIFILLKTWSNRKKAFLHQSLKQGLVFFLLAAVLALQGVHYLRWALHPRFQFRDVSRDLGKALPKATIAGLWAPVISLENEHRAHEYFPGAINDTPDFFQKYGITHVFTTTHAGEDKKFVMNFPDVMARAKLLARYHIWNVEVLLYDIQPASAPSDQKAYEAELFTQKGSTPRFDPQASGTFSILSRGKQKRFVVSIPTKRLLQEGTYTISFRMKRQEHLREDAQRIARIDAVSENRKKALAYKDILPEDLSPSEYRSIRMTLKIKFSEDITFRVFSHGKGDFWVDRVDIQNID